MMQSNGKNAKTEAWLAIGLIILASVLTYGILIPKLGFYRDDWYMLWSGQSKGGLPAIISLFQTDRPLVGWIYALIFNILGANVLKWQFFALVLKVFTGLNVLCLLRMVWPEKRLETTSAALLFVLYPGFFQQPVAATFCIDLLGLNAFFVSVILTIYAVKTSNRLLQILATLIAVALGLINLGLYEATIGLEVVRWALVWVVLQQKKRTETIKTIYSKTVKQAPDQIVPQEKTNLFGLACSAFKLLAPYVLMLAGFIFWRLFIFKSVRRATNIDVLIADYAINPLYSFGQISINYLKDLFETVVLAWFVPFYQFTAEGRINTFTSSLEVALVVLALAGAYVFCLRRIYPENKIDTPENHDFLWVGLIAVVVPTAVIVLLGRNVIFSIQWDRYTTQSMLGVGILISGLAFQFLRSKVRWTVLAILIILAVMTQYHSAASYSRLWDYERDFIWQLSWRAPGLQPGTTIIASLPEGFTLAEEYEVWGPVNMAYYPGQNMQVSGQILTGDLILDLKARTVDVRIMRNINVTRDYGKPLIVSLSSESSCAHILDGQQLALPLFEKAQIKEVANYSNIKLIDLTAKSITPPVSIFGPEPKHDWCFYYQKIELALQSRNFTEAAHLADEASQLDLNPIDASEWVPVIEAYTGSGESRKASATIKRIDRSLLKYICLQQSTSTQPSEADSISKIMCGIN